MNHRIPLSFPALSFVSILIFGCNSAGKDTDIGIVDTADSGQVDSADIDDDGDGFTENDGDCDDERPDIHPDAIEICDTIDNDCDQLVDDEDDSIDQSTQIAFYLDLDADGFGDPNNVVYSCLLQEGYVELSGDCNDEDAAFYPGAPEICDGEVNDCDSTNEVETPYVWFTDEQGAVTDMTPEFLGTMTAPSEVTIYESGVLEICGDFYASLDLAALDVTVRSSFGGYFSSLDAAGSDHVIAVVFPNSTISIENLFITGGHAMDGGGVFNPQSQSSTNSIVIQECEITGNYAWDDGGGIHLHNANLMVIDSLIHGNSSENAGAGIYVSEHDLVLENTEVYENECRNGGGVYVGGGSLLMTDTMIHNNNAVDTGGGVFSWGTDIIMEDSFVHNNTAGIYGGGFMFDTGTLTCTASGDHAAGITGNSSGQAGAMWVQTNGDISHQIISNNCDWGSDSEGNNNSMDDIVYLQGATLEFGQLETFICDFDGCQ